MVWEDQGTEPAHEKKKKWMKGEKRSRTRDWNKNTLAHIALGNSVWRLSCLVRQEGADMLDTLQAILQRSQVNGPPPCFPLPSILCCSSTRMLAAPRQEIRLSWEGLFKDNPATKSTNIRESDGLPLRFTTSLALWSVIGSWTDLAGWVSYAFHSQVHPSQFVRINQRRRQVKSPNELMDGCMELWYHTVEERSARSAEDTFGSMMRSSYWGMTCCFLPLTIVSYKYTRRRNTVWWRWRVVYVLTSLSLISVYRMCYG